MIEHWLLRTIWHDQCHNNCLYDDNYVKEIKKLAYCIGNGNYGVVYVKIK